MNRYRFEVTWITPSGRTVVDVQWRFDRTLSGALASVNDQYRHYQASIVGGLYSRGTSAE